MPSIIIRSTLEPSNGTTPFDSEKVGAPHDTNPPDNKPLPPPNDTLLDETNLTWISSITEEILLHLDDLAEFESTCQKLRDLGKRLKADDNSSGATIKQAIQVMIYHCRASIYFHKKEWVRTIDACRKCIAIPSVWPKAALLQAHATVMMEQSRNKSSHAFATAALMVCALCSAEKLAMPVCAQCKSQPYCSIKCLKQDQLRHSSQCHR